MYEYGQTVCNPCWQKRHAEGDSTGRISAGQTATSPRAPEYRPDWSEDPEMPSWKSPERLAYEELVQARRRAEQGPPQIQRKEPAEQKTWLQKVDRYTDDAHIGSDDGLPRILASMVRGLFESVAGFMIVPLFMVGIGLVGISFWGAFLLFMKALEALGG